MYEWIRYKNLGWIDNKGCKYYEGRFQKENEPGDWTTIRIRFWSKHPTNAMRTICQKAKDEQDLFNFNGKRL